MKNLSPVIFWTGFFGITLAILSIVAWNFTKPTEIVISNQQALVIGERVWMNEGNGLRENLIVWNKGENFPSLGIGHFIWYPKNINPGFQESFPDFLSHFTSKKTLPIWLANQQFPPWNTREDFLDNKNSDFTLKLFQFLEETKAEQIQFIIYRLENALPKILKEIKNPFAKMKVRENFYNIALQKNGVYALVDYVNFKGEGTSPNERYKNKGWGLAQVLEHMNGKSEQLMQEFVTSADVMLTRRVENAPNDESRWLPGWRNRLQTYLN